MNDSDTTAVATSTEQIGYLQDLLQHQKEIFNQEEEQCAFLTSMLLSSNFRKLSEKAFLSAFRKRNT